MKQTKIDFYIKKEVRELWYGDIKTVSFDEFLSKHKFYTKGFIKTKIFKLIMWLMRKLKMSIDIDMSNTREFLVKYRIDYSNLYKVIKDQKIDLDYIMHERPKYLIIGNDIFEKLTGERAIGYGTIPAELQLQFNSKRVYDEFDHYNFKPPVYEKEVMFWGFKIVVVPWINGCFLLPEV